MQVRQWAQRIPAADGIVITGGVALNPHINGALMREGLLPVHVPLIPHDTGLSLGSALAAAWCSMPDDQKSPGLPKAMPFIGLPVSDLELLPDLQRRLGGVPARLEHIAMLLASGKIVAIVRGRAEGGFYGLGHRSILASVDIRNSTAIMNSLAGRVRFCKRNCAAPATSSLPCALEGQREAGDVVERREACHVRWVLLTALKRDSATSMAWSRRDWS